MTAATFDTNTVQGAPRRLVDDAWVALNRRYAIGTGVLVTALALLWGIGSGPGAWRAAEPAANSAPGVMNAPSGLSREATGGATSSSGSGRSTPSGSSMGASSGSAATAGGGSPAPAGSAANGGSPSTAARAASTGGAGPAAANGAAASGGASASGTGPSAAGNGAPAAATLKALPGAPVGRLYFEPDQAWPSGEVGPPLAAVLARLKAEPDTKALVSGFHDRRGSPEANAVLAQRRAQSVRRVLIREGIAADRIVLAKPQQTQGSGADREARRVEVTVAR